MTVGPWRVCGRRRPVGATTWPLPEPGRRRSRRHALAQGASATRERSEAPRSRKAYHPHGEQGAVVPYCIACGSPIDRGNHCGAHQQDRDEAQITDAMPVRAGRLARTRDLIVVPLLIGLVFPATAILVQSRAQLQEMNAELAELRGLQERLVAERFLELAITDQEVQETLQSVQERLGNLGSEIDEAVLTATATSTPEAGYVIDKLTDALFTVVTDTGQGSAFAVGYDQGRTSLITAFHVVEATWGRSQRTVQLVSGDLTYTASVDAVSVSDDLALLSTPHRFPTLSGAKGGTTVGDSVFVGGSPLGLEATVSSGIVSAIRADSIQITAPISPGSSGGPVVSVEGQVIGVAVAKYVGGGAEGLGFAVPWDVVCRTVFDC
jgi:putative serine protease PepD